MTAFKVEMSQFYVSRLEENVVEMMDLPLSFYGSVTLHANYVGTPPIATVLNVQCGYAISQASGLSTAETK